MPMKRIFRIVFLVVFVNCIGAQESIQVNNSEIHFIGGKILKLKENDFYHVYLNKKRVVVIAQNKKANYSEHTIYFFDFLGKEISHTDKLIGAFSFKYFDEKERLLAGQRATLVMAYTSYLYDLDGTLIKQIITPDQENKEIGVTDDENYFWFVANKIRPISKEEEPLHLFPPYTRIMPYNHVIIFNSLTGTIEQEYDTEGTTLNFELNNKKYSITMSQADMPG